MIDKDEEGFLSRWSRKKSADEGIVENDNTEQVEEKKPAEEPLDIDEQSLPLWQQKDVDPDIKKKALATLFKQSEFKDVDHMNEYDEDFTSFSGLGDVVTQEMKRMLRLAEQKTRPESDTDTEQQQDMVNSLAEKNDDVDKDNEDEKLA